MRIQWDCGIVIEPDVNDAGDDIIWEEWNLLKAFYDELEKIGTIHIGKKLLTGDPKNNSRLTVRNLDNQDTIV